MTSWRFARDKSGARGFTLVEVLLAVALMSVGLVAVVGSFGSSLDAMGTAVTASQATAALEETIWRVQADPYEYLKRGEGEVEGYGAGMRWRVEERPLPRGLERGDPLVHVWVSVAWPQDGRWRSIGAATLVWSPPLPGGQGQ